MILVRIPIKNDEVGGQHPYLFAGMLFIPLWLLFFDIYFPALGPGACQLIALSLMAILFLITGPKVRLYQGQSVHYMCWFVLLTFALIRDYLSPSFDFFPSLLKIFVIWFGSWCFALLSNHLLGIKNGIRLLIFVILLQSLTPFIGQLSESFYDLSQTLQSPSVGDPNKFGLWRIRGSFFAGSGYFGMSIALGVACCICALSLINNYINSAVFVLAILPIIAASILAGRVSMIFIFCCVGFLFFRRPVIIIISIFMFFLGFLFLFEIFPEEMSSVWDWVLNSFFGESTQILFESMYYIPELKTIFLGDGEFYKNNGFYYGDTDAGYMRQILFGGIFFTGLILIIMYFLISPIKNKYFRNLLFLTLAVAHIKGLVILSSPMAMAILFTYIYINANYRTKLSN